LYYYFDIVKGSVQLIGYSDKPNELNTIEMANETVLILKLELDLVADRLGLVVIKNKHELRVNIAAGPLVAMLHPQL